MVEIKKQNVIRNSLYLPELLEYLPAYIERALIEEISYISRVPWLMISGLRVILPDMACKRLHSFHPGTLLVSNRHMS